MPPSQTEQSYHNKQNSYQYEDQSFHSNEEEQPIEEPEIDEDESFHESLQQEEEQYDEQSSEQNEQFDYQSRQPVHRKNQYQSFHQNQRFQQNGQRFQSNERHPGNQSFHKNKGGQYQVRFEKNFPVMRNRLFEHNFSQEIYLYIHMNSLNR